MDDEQTCPGCGDAARLTRHGGSPLALCDGCERKRLDYLEAHRPRTLEESMTSLLRFSWCGNATGRIRAMTAEQQEEHVLVKLSPGLAAQWRQVLGLPAVLEARRCYACGSASMMMTGHRKAPPASALGTLRLRRFDGWMRRVADARCQSLVLHVDDEQLQSQVPSCKALDHLGADPQDSLQVARSEGEARAIRVRHDQGRW